MIGTRDTGISGHYEALVRSYSPNSCVYNVISDENINRNPLLSSGKRVPGAGKRDFREIVEPLTADDLKDPNSKFSKDCYLLFYE